MPFLNIRNIPNSLHSALLIKAAKAGRTMEAEALHILEDACNESKKPILVKELQALVEILNEEQKPIHITNDVVIHQRQVKSGEPGE